MPEGVELNLQYLPAGAGLSAFYWCLPAPCLQRRRKRQMIHLDASAELLILGLQKILDPPWFKHAWFGLSLLQEDRKSYFSFYFLFLIHVCPSWQTERARFTDRAKITSSDLIGLINECQSPWLYSCLISCFFTAAQWRVVQIDGTCRRIRRHAHRRSHTWS